MKTRVIECIVLWRRLKERVRSTERLAINSISLKHVCSCTTLRTICTYQTVCGVIEAMKVSERELWVFANENEKNFEVILHVEAFEERYHMVDGGFEHFDREIGKATALDEFRPVTYK